MEKVKSVFKPKTRQDISNPWHNIPHKELLKLAGIEDISDNYKIIHLPDGKIKVVKGDKHE